MPDKQQYFVALIPPEPIRGQLQELKEHFRDVYGSKASLNSDPHITLHMPFKWRQDREERLLDTLKKLVQEYHPFEIKLNGFGSFPPRVIFTQVEESDPLIQLQAEVQQSFRRELKLMNANYRQRAFHPHITLAFRDLKKPAFASAWNEFEDKPYYADWLVDQLFLLKHDGKRWQRYASISLT